MPSSATGMLDACALTVEEVEISERLTSNSLVRPSHATVLLTGLLRICQNPGLHALPDQTWKMGFFECDSC